jgi:endonuclease G
MLVQNGDFDASRYGPWQERLDPYRAKIKAIIAGVGRVELKNHPSGYPWLGTCWLIDDDVLITNRHVAKLFSLMRQGSWQIMPGVEVNVDFAEELGSREALEYLIGSIIHIEDNENIDLALMKLARHSAGRLGLSPVPLDTRLSQAEYIGTIGYPADDLRNNPRDAFTKYFQGQFGVKRFAPGRIMNANYRREQFTHNCTTLGGNSGSVVFNVASGGAVGLHFGGNAQVQNYAVKAASIATVLGKQNVRVRPLRDAAAAGVGDAGEERRARAGDFRDRNGYNPSFLGEGPLNVPMPIIGPHMVDLVARTKAGEPVINYRNFSVVLSKPRRLAIFTAVNIDGTSSRNPRRVPSFQLDPRLDADQQTGEAMYRNNDLDRGHLVRRLDPCWGDEDKSNQANVDSMYFPNISPQHKDLNQKIWNDLEDHVLGTVDDRDFRVSVFTGCLFKDTDPEQQRSHVKVPMAFWKVIVSLSRDGGRSRGRGRGRDGGSPQLQTQAFVMSQAHLVKPGDLEFVFGKGFETFQVTLEQLERMTGLDFHKMKASDTFGMTPEAREAFAAESTLESAIDIERNEHFKPLQSLDDIVM